MPEIQLFQNPQFGEIRTVQINGEPWFVAKDICFALGLGNTSQAVSRLEESEKTTVIKNDIGIINDLDINPKIILINESGLYFLIFKSQKPEARDFQKWVTSEVLPAIRKHGGYLTEKTIEDILNDPDTIIRMAQTIKAEREKIKKLESEKKESLPKIEFYDAVTGSSDTIDIGQAAKVLNLGYGRNRLFEILREKNILQNNNQPYQKYIDAGYFRVIESKYIKPDGSIHISLKTVVYQKGLDYIRKIVSNLKGGK